MADVKRAVKMFEMTRVPVAGIVENMAFFRCPDNGKDYPIFGTGRTEAACKEMGLPLLASFPLDMGVGPAADQGQPISYPSPEANKQLFRKLAEKLATNSSRKATRTRLISFQIFFLRIGMTCS